MTKKNKGLDLNQMLWVSVLEAKDNPGFPQWMTDGMRFLHFNQAVECAACKKKGKRMWTMLCPFKTANFGAGIHVLPMFKDAQGNDIIFPPLTAVCDEHPLHPAVELIPGYKEWKEQQDAKANSRSAENVDRPPKADRPGSRR